MLERVVERVRREPVLAQHVDEGAGIDRAGAGRHRHALERAEAHRRVDRAPVEHGGDGAAAAEVADDEPAHRTCSAAHATASPWNPYRRMPHSSRHRAGTA